MAEVARDERIEEKVLTTMSTSAPSNRFNICMIYMKYEGDQWVKFAAGVISNKFEMAASAV